MLVEGGCIFLFFFWVCLLWVCFLILCNGCIKKFLILCYEGNGYIKNSFFASFLIIPTRPSAY